MDKDKIRDTFACLWFGSGHAPETGIRIIDRILHFMIILLFPNGVMILLKVQNQLLYWTGFVLLVILLEAILYVAMKLVKDDEVYISRDDIEKYGD